LSRLRGAPPSASRAAAAKEPAAPSPPVVAAQNDKPAVPPSKKLPDAGAGASAVAALPPAAAPAASPVAAAPPAVGTAPVAEKNAAEESPAEQFARKGLSAFADKDFRKAQKLLEKAKALCGRARKQAAGCAAVSGELSARLGQVYDGQERFAEAMAEYQRALDAGASRLPPALHAEVQAAVTRLLPRLGRIVLPKRTGDRCEEATMYMPPGTHTVVVDGKGQTVTVRARETVKVGACQ
jgi:tetratricopeptide (TPR) repeat protein